MALCPQQCRTTHSIVYKEHREIWSKGPQMTRPLSLFYFLFSKTHNFVYTVPYKAYCVYSIDAALGCA